jgi:hypothetical protein
LVPNYVIVPPAVIAANFLIYNLLPAIAFANVEESAFAEKAMTLCDLQSETPRSQGQNGAGQSECIKICQQWQNLEKIQFTKTFV